MCFQAQGLRLKTAGIDSFVFGEKNATSFSFSVCRKYTVGISVYKEIPVFDKTAIINISLTVLFYLNVEF